MEFRAPDPETPAQLGFAMPAEWEPHEATWLGWPHCRSDWPGKLHTIEWVYGEIVRKIAEGENVRIIVDEPSREARARRILTRAQANLANVEFFRAPSDRGWARDFGPICVRKPGSRPEVAVAKFKFTAWAKYPNWQQDNRIAERIAKRRSMRLFPVTREGEPIVLEVLSLMALMMTPRTAKAARSTLAAAGLTSPVTASMVDACVDALVSMGRTFVWMTLDAETMSLAADAKAWSAVVIRFIFVFFFPPGVPGIRHGREERIAAPLTAKLVGFKFR